jgi:hypothetical protein
VDVVIDGRVVAVDVVVVATVVEVLEPEAVDGSRGGVDGLAGATQAGACRPYDVTSYLVTEPTKAAMPSDSAMAGPRRRHTGRRAGRVGSLADGETEPSQWPGIRPVSRASARRALRLSGPR